MCTEGSVEVTKHHPSPMVKPVCVCKRVQRVVKECILLKLHLSHSAVPPLYRPHPFNPKISFARSAFCEFHAHAPPFWMKWQEFISMLSGREMLAVMRGGERVLQFPTQHLLHCNFGVFNSYDIHQEVSNSLGVSVSNIFSNTVASATPVLRYRFGILLRQR